MTQSLLPPNATQLEVDLEATQARAFDLPVDIRKIWRPQECPAHLLPWLAWALSVEEWNAAWDEAKKREVIAASVAIHRKKGTVGAVKRALVLADAPDAIIKEWWEFSGTPRTFQIHLSEGHVAVSTKQRQETLLKLVFAAKPVAAHLGKVEISAELSINVYADLKTAGVGVTWDTRTPTEQAQLNFFEKLDLELVGHAKQHGPIPQRIYFKPAALHIALLTRPHALREDLSNRAVFVFKPVPEGEISPGAVTVKRNAEHAINGMTYTHVMRNDAHISSDKTDAPLQPAIETLVQMREHTPKPSTGFLVHPSLFSNALSNNAGQRETVESARLRVFRRELPTDGELRPGEVRVTREADRDLQADLYSFALQPINTTEQTLLNAAHLAYLSLNNRIRQPVQNAAVNVFRAYYA